MKPLLPLTLDHSHFEYVPCNTPLLSILVYYASAAVQQYATHKA